MADDDGDDTERAAAIDAKHQRREITRLSEAFLRQVLGLEGGCARRAQLGTLNQLGIDTRHRSHRVPKNNITRARASGSTKRDRASDEAEAGPSGSGPKRLRSTTR